ncbi:MAG: hypothetical protein WC840_02435 [Candidatus Peribacteraceae bacterium]
MSSKKPLNLAELSQAYDQLGGANQSIVQNAVQSGRLRWRTYAGFLTSFRECGGQIDRREVDATVQAIRQIIADSLATGYEVLTLPEMAAETAAAEERARKLRELMPKLEGVRKEKEQQRGHAQRSGSSKAWARYDALHEQEWTLRTEIETLERQGSGAGSRDGDHQSGRQLY